MGSKFGWGSKGNLILTDDAIVLDTCMRIPCIHLHEVRGHAEFPQHCALTDPLRFRGVVAGLLAALPFIYRVVKTLLAA